MAVNPVYPVNRIADTSSDASTLHRLMAWVGNDDEDPGILSARVVERILLLENQLAEYEIQLDKLEGDLESVAQWLVSAPI